MTALAGVGMMAYGGRLWYRSNNTDSGNDLWGGTALAAAGLAVVLVGALVVPEYGHALPWIGAGCPPAP